MSCIYTQIDPPYTLCEICGDVAEHCSCTDGLCSDCMCPLDEWEIENGLSVCRFCQMDAQMARSEEAA